MLEQDLCIVCRQNTVPRLAAQCTKCRTNDWKQKDESRGTASTIIQRHWRGIFQRKFGILVWVRLDLLEKQNNAAIRLQKAARVAAIRRRALYHTREENADRALSVIERLLHAFHRARKAKRAVKTRHERLSAIIIQKIQRGISARCQYWSERGTHDRQVAVQRIQRALLVWHAKLRDAKLRALSIHFNTCARCGASCPSEFVFDLQEALCLNCVVTMSGALSSKGQCLRSRGQLLGTMLPLNLKRRLDVYASHLQSWWRSRISIVAAHEGICVSCHRAATHIDHVLKQQICRRCAQVSRRLYSLRTTNRRVQTIAQYKIDESAALVIHAFWRSW